MAHEDEGALLRAWQQGDARAGNAFVKRHFQLVYAFLATKVDDPKDLTQRTFLACLEGADRFRGESSLNTYLLAIARKQLYSDIRKRHVRDRAFDPTLVCAAELGPSPSSALDHKREQRLMIAALRSLPLQVQILLELTYWEAMKQDDIAVVLDIPAGTVKSRLHRARAQLREAVTRLAESPDLRQTTLDNLERWALSVRAQLEGAAGSS